MKRKIKKIINILILIFVSIQGFVLAGSIGWHQNNSMQQLSADQNNRKPDSIIYPEVGKHCPNFILSDINYYHLNKGSLSDFAGKWLILDFWASNCGSCIASFPKVNQLQKEYSSQLQYMMVGIEDPNRLVEQLYRKYKDREGLIMPCAFDSTLYRRWGVRGVPHLIIIDTKGIVQGITSSLDTDQVKTFLSGGHPELARVYDPFNAKNSRIPFDDNQPFLANANGGTDSDFLYRSLLSWYDPFNQSMFLPSNIGDSVKKGSFQVLGAHLSWLYNYAFFGVNNPAGRWDDPATYGQYRNLPIVQVRNSAMFNWTTHKKEGNIFCYSLIMPPSKSSTPVFQSILQEDLKRYFGFNAKVELRDCPVWELVATEEARKKLKAHGGKFTITGSFKTGFSAKNYPIKDLLGLICMTYRDETFLDKTGINGEIDITLDGMWNNIEDARRALQIIGLDLIPAQKKMKVVVITDGETGNESH